MNFDRVGFEREVGRRLHHARKTRGMTQDEIAKRIGLPRPSYANIELGRQRIPVDVLWRAAVVLGLSVAALVPDPVNKKRGTASVVQLRRYALPDSVGTWGFAAHDLAPNVHVTQTLGLSASAMPHLPAAEAEDD